MRPTHLIPAVAAVLLLASCASPSAPVDPTPDQTSDAPTTAPVGDRPFGTCDDATVDSLSASLDGQLLFDPIENSFPLFLPAPSCIAYPTDQGISIAFYAGGSQEDFETIESTVVEQQGQGQAVDPIAPPVLAAETWEQGGVIDLRYFDTANGVPGPLIQVTSVIANYTPGG